MSESLNTEVVTQHLSRLIASELHAMSSEYWQPRFAADQMDSELNFRKMRIKELRRLRHEFENLMFGFDKDTL